MPGPENADDDEPPGHTGCDVMPAGHPVNCVVPGPENADGDEPRGHPDMTSCLRSSCKLCSAGT